MFLTLLLPCLWAQTHLPSAPDFRAGSWQPLLNGRDLAGWVSRGGRSLGKPTHCESTDGRF